MINEEHGDPYMMSRTIVNHLLIDLLALRVSNPSCELDRTLVDAHTTYRRNKAIHRHIFVFWLVNKEK
jgi:hypothetical protein